MVAHNFSIELKYPHSANFKLQSVGALLLFTSQTHALLACSSPCLQAQWYHQGSQPLGRCWQRGDVVGCLLDLAERTMMVTLNGELQFSSRGSELASKDFDVMDGQNDVFSF